MQLPKEKPSLEESYVNTAVQFGQVISILDEYFDDFEPLRIKKMKRGNDRELGIISSFSLMVLKLTVDSLRKNWNLTYILRDIIFDQNEILEKLVNRLESKATTDDDKKDVANIKHAFIELKKQFESVRAEFDTTKHKADTAQQLANDVRKETIKFSKMEELANKLNEIIKEKGGKDEFE